MRFSIARYLTLRLVREGCRPGQASGYRYSRFYRRIQQWKRQQALVLRQNHLNQRPFRKLPATRARRFAELDWAGLRTSIDFAPR